MKFIWPLVFIVFAGCITHRGVAEEWPLADNPRLKKEITKDEFTRIYEANQDQLGRTCAVPAMDYCGKVTKDLHVTAEEVTCLWTKAFRVTREILPKLDHTPCDQLIKSLAR